jgi:hypothetical protein
MPTSRDERGNSYGNRWYVLWQRLAGVTTEDCKLKITQQQQDSRQVPLLGRAVLAGLAALTAMGHGPWAMGLSGLSMGRAGFFGKPMKAQARGPLSLAGQLTPKSLNTVRFP